MDYTFKIADSIEEKEQLLLLNYKTFVEEIPQHSPNVKKSLEDQFHEENVYFICKDKEEVIGMLAIRENRPFSLDKKLPDLDKYFPEKRDICEIRLLAIKKERRSGVIFLGIIAKAAQYCEKKDYKYAIISGVVGRLNFYTKLGFLPFGPCVGGKKALYQPMYLDTTGYYNVTKRKIENIANKYQHGDFF